MTPKQLNALQSLRNVVDRMRTIRFHMRGGTSSGKQKAYGSAIEMFGLANSARREMGEVSAEDKLSPQYQEFERLLAEQDQMEADAKADHNRLGEGHWP